MYYISMVITVLATVMYNISQKSINQTINPFISMLVTYITAILFSVIAFIFLPIDRNIVSSLKQLNWASYLLGLSALGLEIGYLYLYRSGWNIAVAPLFVSIISTIMLIIIGIIFYKTKISPVNTIGVCISIIGLILMNRK